MSYYQATSQQTIPSVEARLDALPSTADLLLTVEIDGTQYTKAFDIDALTWPWYANGGGVEQAYSFALPSESGLPDGSVSWFHDALGDYRFAIQFEMPFTVVATSENDLDLHTLLNFGTPVFFESPIDPPPTDPTPEEPTVTTPTYGAGILHAVAVAAALRAELDERIGWHKSLSNVAVTGPTGISEPITWDLEDPDTDAGYLNSHDITTLIQHVGFRFWGNRTCSDDPRFAFEVATRTAQTVLETIVQGCFPFVDQPLIPSLAKDIIDSINAKLTELVSSNRLIGASCWYDPNASGNSVQALSQGQFFVDYDYTPVPTLENLGLNQRITDRYLVDFSKLIAQAA
ncbi:MAG: hypothetical protein RLY58_849 [Pseudomonadota bacterium]|jgi:hypothetical protein